MGRLVLRIAWAGVSVLGGIGGLAIGAAAGWVYERRLARRDASTPGVGAVPAHQPERGR
jgi:membrane associated rhomboid family serine protease